MTTRIHEAPPPLAQNMSQDDEEEEEEDYYNHHNNGEYDPHAALVDNVRAANSQSHREALAYLLRYETMVRQQEAEDMATLAHVRPCIARLQELVTGGVNNKPTSTTESSSATHHHLDNDALMEESVSFAQLRAALETMESSPRIEFMSTDRQLIMVLRMLTAKTTEMDEVTTLTWAEFVQCYKTCIGGMLTLQHLPPSHPARSRARDRTLSMLSLFEPPSTKLFTDDEDHHNDNGQQLQTPTFDSRALTSPSRRAGLTVPSPGARRARRVIRLLLLTVVVLLVILAVVVLDPELLNDEEHQPLHAPSASVRPLLPRSVLTTTPPSPTAKTSTS